MAKRRSNKGRNGRAGGIVTVARDGDVAGAKFDRMVSNMRLNESAIPILVKGAAGVDSGDERSLVYDYGNIAAGDEFKDMAKQFRLFKVKAIRFEVFHQVASFAQPMVLSTFHSQETSISASIDDVIDGEDAKFLDAGAGKQVFYWTARGVPETEYQACSSFESLGGLRLFRQQNAVNPNLRQITIVWTAQVVFKGRY